MKYGLYVINDVVAKESGFPFDAKNDGVAIRKMNSFLAEVTKNGNVSESEFELWKVADFDSETLEIIPCCKDVDLLNNSKEE